jgi:hypothetical protein
VQAVILFSKPSRESFWKEALTLPISVFQTILAAVRIFRALAPVNQANESTVQPLLRLLHSEIPIRRVVLSYILSLVLEDPVSCGVCCGDIIDNRLQKAWVSHVSSFILRAHDNAIIKSLKLKILMALQTSTNTRFLEREFSVCLD